MKKLCAFAVVVLAVPSLQGDGRLQHVDSVGGYKIAFVSDRDGNSEIYVMNSDGTGQTRLTNNKAWDASPAFSPDGSKIAFVSSDKSASSIYVMNSDGADLTKLTKDGNSDYAPAWSPDGSKIVFSSARNIDPQIALLLSNIYVMNSDGTGEKQLTDHRSTNGSPRFSPDGLKIVFHSSRGPGGSAYSMNVDGSEKELLKRKDEPGWVYSPDGSKIVYAFTSPSESSPDIYVMNADGSQVKQLTTNSGYSPVFSPDGSKIVFMSWRDPNWAICVMNLDGTGVTHLTDSKARDTSPAVPRRQRK